MLSTISFMAVAFLSALAIETFKEQKINPNHTSLFTTKFNIYVGSIILLSIVISLL